MIILRQWLLCLDLWNDSFNLIADSGFDPEINVISDVDLGGGFVVASRVLVSHQGNDLRVEGNSTGRSILLLPFEYSHCFDIATRSGERPVLFRANTLLTGVVFTGTLDVWLKFRTGPIHNSTCRIQDAKDFRKAMSN